MSTQQNVIVAKSLYQNIIKAEEEKIIGEQNLVTLYEYYTVPWGA